MACEPLLLNSQIFRNYIARKVIQAMHSATGHRTEIGNVHLESWPLSIHFYDLRVYEKEGWNELQLMRTQEVTVSPSIRSLWQRKLVLRDLVIQHPVLRIVLDHEGKAPQPLGTVEDTPGADLDLSISHLVLNKGEINYQDRNIPLNADLHDLAIEVLFDSQAKRYKGSISYQNARIHYLNYTPAPHSVIAKFNADPSHLSIESLRATAGLSTLFMSAEIDDFRNPNVAANYDLRINARDVVAGFWPITLGGETTLFGRLHYKSSRKRSFLLNLAIDGQLASDRVTASSKDGLLEVRWLHGRYELKDGTLLARNSSAGVLGGKVGFNVNIQRLNSIPSYQIAASLQGISLQAIQQAIRIPRMNQLALLGRLDGSADATWSGAMHNAITHADLVVHSATNTQEHHPDNSVPVDAIIHLTYSGPQSALALRQTTVSLGSMTLALEGELSEHSNLQMDVAFPDIRDVGNLMPAVSSGKTLLGGISGSAKIRATMRGRIQEPHFFGQLTVLGLRNHNTEWDSARATVQLSPSDFVLQNGSLVNANQGKAFLSGSIGLHNWSYLDASPMRVNLSLQAIRVVDLLRMANLSYPASGELYGHINLHGSEIDPVGEASIKIANAHFFDEALHSVALDMHAENGRVSSTVNIEMPAGAATVNLSYAPKNKSYDFRLNAPSFALQGLHVVRVRNLPLSGAAKLSAEGQGTLDNPQLNAVVDVPEAIFDDNVVSPLRGEVHIANKRAELELSAGLGSGSVKAVGFVQLSGNYYSEAVINTSRLQIAHLIDAVPHKSREGFRAETEIHATLRGPLNNTDQLEAHLTIPTLSATYESWQISTAEPIRIDCARSVANVQPAELRGSGTSIRVNGSIPLDGVSPLHLTVQGTINAGLFRMVQPDVRSSGVISFDVRTSGSTVNPSFQGQIQLRAVALSTDTSQIGLENVNGSLDIENNRVRISSLSGQLGGGELSLTGAVLYWPRPRFDLALQAKAVRLRHPAGLRMSLEGNIALTGSSNQSMLNGRVLIEDFSFTPEFQLTKLSEYFGNKGTRHQGGLGDSVKLSVAVQSNNRLSAASPLASLEGNVNLRVAGTAADPVITGRTDLTSGEVFYRSRRYQFERGIVVFSDPNETRPALDVSATTTVQQYNLSLSVRGYLDKLITTYSSDPPLATADIINLIALGSTTQAAGSAGNATDSIVASQVAGQISTRMQGLTGISGLRIDPLVGGNNRDPSARIGVQQRVTKNFLFTFSTDVSKAGGETIEGKYQINRRWSIGAARDQVGGVAVQGHYHTKF